MDEFLKRAWKTLCLLSSLAAVILAALFSIASKTWDALARMDSMSEISGRISRFYRAAMNFLDFFSAGRIFEILSDLLAGVKGKLDSSAKARRWFFAILFISVLLFMYPPSRWGPWYFHEHGVASHYGRGFYFNRTSSGEWFLPFGRLTAAHKTLPLGITVLVRNPANGRQIIVKINDRGPYIKDRNIDLCTSAAKKLGITGKGTAEVDIYTRRKYK